MLIESRHLSLFGRDVQKLSSLRRAMSNTSFFRSNRSKQISLRSSMVELIFSGRKSRTTLVETNENYKNLGLFFLTPAPHLQIFINEVTSLCTIVMKIDMQTDRAWQTNLVFIINLVKPLVRP